MSGGDTGMTACRLDKVTMENDVGPSIDASTDPLEKFAQGLTKGLTFQEMTHNVRALFLSNDHDLSKTPPLALMFPESARGCLV